MPPQKATPMMESLETYYREDDGVTSSVKKLSKDVQNRKSIGDDSFSNWEGLKFDQSVRRRESDASSMLTEDTDSFIVGDRVWVGGNKPGVIAFIGETQFGPGDWAGVVLDDAIGKNDGSVAGIRYFQCPLNRGIFSRLSRLSRYPIDPSEMSRLLKTPGTPDRKQALTASPTSSISSRVQLPYSYNSIPNSSGADIKVGDRVIVQSSHGSKAGVLKYYGNTEFGAGLWCGVELDDPLGKNDGSVAGVRYFDCAPKFGLFVPAEKVSRSPISNKKASCVVHPDGISRQGTLDSIRTTSSTINTSISSIKSNSRVRLGVNSLGKQKPTSRPSMTPARTSTTQAPKSPLQEQLKEKENYIKQLLKERELERAELIRAATQAEEVEKKLSYLKKDYDEACSKLELQKTNHHQVVERLEKDKSKLEIQLDEEKKKIEDLQFNYEEESITKSEIQALNEEYVEKLKNLEKVVSSTNASLEYDCQSSGNFDNNDLVVSASKALTLADSCTDLSEELSNSKKLISTLTEKKTELQNECISLKETLEKMKIIDKNKDELINNLKNEALSFQQLDIGIENETSILKNELVNIKEKLTASEKENETVKKELLTLKQKLASFESTIAQKDMEIKEKNALIIAKEQELQNEIDNANNNLQFELDEYKIKTEELLKKIKQLTEDIDSNEQKHKNYVDASIKCLIQLSNDLKNERDIVTNVILGNETASNAISTLRSRDSSFPSLIDNCPEELKDGSLELQQQMEQITNNNVMFIEKIETLTEVISRKDAQIEEIIKEKENLRKEYLESIENKTSELKNLESKYADLNIVKNDIERQLKISEENIRKMESLSVDKDHLASEIENMRKILDEKSLTCDKLSQDATTLQNELKAKNEENRITQETLEKEKENLKQEIDKISDQLKNEIAEKNAIIKDFNELQKVNEVTLTLNEAKNEENRITQETLEKEKENLKQEIDKISDQLKNEIAEKNVIKKDFNELQKVNEVTLTLNQAKNADEFETLKKKIEELITQNQSKVDELKEMENKCKQFEEKELNLKKEMSDVENNLKNISKKLKEFDNFCDKDKIKSSTLQNNPEIYLEDLCVYIKDLQNNCETLQNSYKILENCKNDLEKQLNCVKEESSQMKDKLDGVSLQKDNLEKQMEKFLSEKQCLGEQVNKHELEFSKINSKYDELKSECDKKVKDFEDIQKKKDSLENENQSLKKEAESLKSEISNLKENMQNKEQEIEVDKKEMEQNLKHLENSNNEFKEKQKQYAEMDKEIILLREKVICLNEELSSNEKKFQVEIALSNKNIQELLSEKETLLTECKAVKSQLESLKEELTELRSNLDNANRNRNGVANKKLTNGDLEAQYSDQKNVKKGVESEIKNTQSPSDDNTLNNNIVSVEKNISLENISRELVEAKESAENQVNFLNSVIVDMQRKNENLLERVQYLESRDPSETLECRKPKLVAPRLFCDICDIFDLHETEDCPRQSNSSPPPIQRDTPKIKPPPRPYCENCEIFGHDTNECPVEENF